MVTILISPARFFDGVTLPYQLLFIHYQSGKLPLVWYTIPTYGPDDQQVRLAFSTPQPLLERKWYAADAG